MNPLAKPCHARALSASQDRCCKCPCFGILTPEVLNLSCESWKIVSKSPTLALDRGSLSGSSDLGPLSPEPV